MPKNIGKEDSGCMSAKTGMILASCKCTQSIPGSDSPLLQRPSARTQRVISIQRAKPRKEDTAMMEKEEFKVYITYIVENCSPGLLVGSPRRKV